MVAANEITADHFRFTPGQREGVKWSFVLQGGRENRVLWVTPEGKIHVTQDGTIEEATEAVIDAFRFSVAVKASATEPRPFAVHNDAGEPVLWFERDGSFHAEPDACVDERASEVCRRLGRSLNVLRG